MSPDSVRRLLEDLEAGLAELVRQIERIRRAHGPRVDGAPAVFAELRADEDNEDQAVDVDQADGAQQIVHNSSGPVEVVQK